MKNKVDEGGIAMKLARFEWRKKVRWGIVVGDSLFSLVGNLYTDFKSGKEICRLQKVKLLAPVEPSITIACGMNYVDHIKEMGWKMPREPVLFFKPVNTIIGPEGDISYPTISQDLRYEGELCCVIKRMARNVSEKEAKDCILGYTCGNDLTAMDVTEKDGRLTRSKAFDTAGPLGPFLVTDLDPNNLKIKSRVNGEPRQDSNTGLTLFSAAKLISYISNFMTLRPGDVVWTGTPKGGAHPVKVGDMLEVEIEGIGVLRNRVVAPT
jgi:2-keto-4-pentenoate hydratase/2-oxohepta-3-ene-1,7-dioic acid hydratase in catechol pathway